ncbi:MAG: transporter substrate-binding domain-containing protein, partial [Veillonella sp.]|nr:transporter substrate-binding domain-containing protein [Veillonella sp.]
MFGININKKIMAAIGIGVLAMGLIAGCGSSNKETVQEGVLRVGSETTFPPFEYTDDQGKAIGFDVDLSQAIA